MYPDTKNEVSTSRLSKVRARTGQTDTRTDRQTDRQLDETERIITEDNTAGAEGRRAKGYNYHSVIIIVYYAEAAVQYTQ